MNTLSMTGLLWPLLLSLPIMAIGFSSSQRRWQFAEIFMGANVVLSIVAWAQAIFMSSGTLASSLIHLTPLNTTVLLLISFIALVVLRYAKNNLEGDPDDSRFLKWFITTVLAVIITVTTNHLFVFWLSWTAISLSLHQLLMFYPERPRARLAAHKKFLLARVSESFLALAFITLYLQHGTPVINEILFQIASATELTKAHQFAAVMLAAVALIKCAQLPVHGWLIQVVEAPTPVSALLHAGIINLGGFLLLMFLPLISEIASAQWLILVVAGLSTVVASLIMTTRISIKVRLAWSTTAQMGLMLIECALGLYELALLHLLAHSFYKAYAFLSSGNAVNDFLRHAYVKVSMPSVKNWVLAFISSTVIVTVGVYLADAALPISPWVLVVIALASLFAFRFQRANKVSVFGTLLTGAGIFVFYLVMKKVMPMLLPDVAIHYSWLADAWVSTLFVALLLTYLFLQYQTHSSLSRKLFIALNAGFYLDEWASRATLKVWPINLPRSSKKKIVQPTEVIYE